MSEDCHECCGDDTAPDRKDDTFLGHPVVKDVHVSHPVGDVVAVPATMPSPTVREIVDAYLVANGYDGLFNEDVECACQVGDLAPCGVDFTRCMAGRCKACDCGDHDWHIVSREDA